MQMIELRLLHRRGSFRELITFRETLFLCEAPCRKVLRILSKTNATLYHGVSNLDRKKTRNAHVGHVARELLRLVGDFRGQPDIFELLSNILPRHIASTWFS